jgi:uncharacterized membrane protein (DUF485 family)
MGDDKISDIRQDPLFQELVDKRTRFAWQLSAAMLVIYFGFIAIIAFAPQRERGVRLSRQRTERQDAFSMA